MRLSFAQFNDGYPPVTDGVVTCVRNYAYWLNQKYGECTLFVPDKRRVVYSEPYRVVSYCSIPLISRPPYRVGMPGIDLQYRSALKNLDFDIVHTHSPFSAGLEALRLGRIRHIPVIATFHSKYYDDFYAYTKSKLLSRQGVRILVHRLEQMDSVWTVSEGAAQALRSYGYHGPITVMPNGTDLSMPENPELVKARAGEIIPLSDVPMFLFVGQHIWQKNLRLIYEACKQLAANGERFLMMMVGDGSVRSELMASVEEAGLSEYFAFPGIVKDRELLSSLYLNARALVFPSLYDTSGLVVREAAAMHCPAIVVANSDAAAGIVHHKNGLLCENNIDSLVQQMQYAIQTPEACKHMGQNASHTLARSWESIVGNVFWAYRDVLIDYHRLAVV